MDRRRRVLTHHAIQSEIAGRALDTVGSNSYTALFEENPKICVFSVPELPSYDLDVMRARREFENAAADIQFYRADRQVVFAFFDGDRLDPFGAGDAQDSVKLSFYRHAFLKKLKTTTDAKLISKEQERSISLIDYSGGVLWSLPIYKQSYIVAPGLVISPLAYPTKLTISENLKNSGINFTDRNSLAADLIARRYTDKYRHSSAQLQRA